MMKVALLLLACIGLASAQFQLVTFVNASVCVGGCSLSQALTPASIAAIITSTLLPGTAAYSLDFSGLNSGSTINIDSSGSFSGNQLFVGALNTGGAVVNIASGFTVNTGNFAVQQGSSAVVSGSVVITGAASGAVNTTVAAGSYLTVAAGGSINAGSSTVQASGNTTVAGVITAATYTQSNAYLVLNAAAGTTANVVAATSINIQGGATLSGNGAIGGSGATLNVAATGQISVGNSPGVVTVNGDWRPSGTSIYNFEVASATSYDQLIVTGKAYVNGFARCTRLNNFEPAKNTQFHNAITAGNGIDGSFTSTVGTSSSDIGLWTASVNGNQVIFNFNSATSVVISAFVLVACVLASLL